jgi:hypothetical protein
MTLRRSVGRLLAVGATLALAAATASPAIAQVVTVGDSTGDVKFFDYGDTSRGAFRPDIAKVRVSNDTGHNNRIAVTTSFARFGTFDWAMVKIDTDNDGRPNYYFADKNSGDHARGVYTNHWHFVCRSAETVNRIHNYIKFSADRACFGYPGKIRAKVVVQRYTGCFDDRCYRTWTDVSDLSPLTRRG